MNKNISAALKTFAIVLGTISAVPVYAQAPVPSAAATQNKHQEEIQKLLGETFVARHLLDIKQDEKALPHLAKAKAIASDLVKNAPDLVVTDKMDFAKTTYVFEDVTKDYLMPIGWKKIVVEDYDIVKKAHKDALINVKDSTEVTYHYELNVASALKNLTEAEKKLEAKDGAGARAALDGMYKDVLVEEIAQDDPLQAIRGNLGAALTNIQYKNFREASYALDHAKSELKTLENTDKGAAHAPAVKRISEEVDTIKASLGRDEPETQKIRDKIGGWMNEIKSW